MAGVVGPLRQAKTHAVHRSPDHQTSGTMDWSLGGAPGPQTRWHARRPNPLAWLPGPELARRRLPRGPLASLTMPSQTHHFPNLRLAISTHLHTDHASLGRDYLAMRATAFQAAHS